MPTRRGVARRPSSVRQAHLGQESGVARVVLEASEKRIAFRHREPAVALRMIRNLKSTYLRRRDYDKVLMMIDGLLMTQPLQSPERRDRGVVNYRLGNYDEALDDLEAYVESDSSVPDCNDVQKLIDQIHGILKK